MVPPLAGFRNRHRRRRQLDWYDSATHTHAYSSLMGSSTSRRRNSLPRLPRAPLDDRHPQVPRHLHRDRRRRLHLRLLHDEGAAAQGEAAADHLVRPRVLRGPCILEPRAVLLLHRLVRIVTCYFPLPWPNCMRSSENNEILMVFRGL